MTNDKKKRIAALLLKVLIAALTALTGAVAGNTMMRSIMQPATNTTCP